MSTHFQAQTNTKHHERMHIIHSSCEEIRSILHENTMHTLPEQMYNGRETERESASNAYPLLKHVRTNSEREKY